MAEKILSLTQLRNPIAGKIELNGEIFEVRKFTGPQYQRSALFDDNTPATEFYELVKQVAPTLPDDVVQSLDKDLCWAILLLASQGAAAVERQFPNVPSPETSTSPG